MRVLDHRQISAALLTVMLLNADHGIARIGEDYEGCLRLWGMPAEGVPERPGNGRRVFRLAEKPLEIDFLDGIAQHVSIAATDSGDDAETQKTLGLLGGGETWHAWVPPGLRGEPRSPVRRWIRSDEEAMAEWHEGRLVIVGARWHPHVAASRPEDEKPVEAAAGGRTGSAASPRVAGYWVAAAGGRTNVVLQIDEGGAVAWRVEGPREQSVHAMEWRGESGGAGPSAWVYEPSAEGAAKPLGSFTLRDSGCLLWQADGEPARLEAIHPSLRRMHGSEFNRVASLPVWSPQPPDKLPVKGDSREEALRLLGAPEGRMAGGAREVLVYAWGRVLLMNGRVESLF